MATSTSTLTAAVTERGFYKPRIDDNGHITIPRIATLAIFLVFSGLAAFLIDGFLPDGVRVGGLPIPHGAFIFLWFCAVIIAFVSVTLRPPFPRGAYRAALFFILLAMFLVGVYYLDKPDVQGPLHQLGVAVVTFLENLPQYFFINVLVLGYFLADDVHRWIGGKEYLQFSPELSPEELPRLPALICGDLFLTSVLAFILCGLASLFSGVAPQHAVGIPLNRCLIPVPIGICAQPVNDLNSLYSVSYLDLLLGVLLFLASLCFLLGLMIVSGVKKVSSLLDRVGDAVAEVVIAAIGAGIKNRNLLFITLRFLRRIGYVTWPLWLMGSVGLVSIAASSIGDYYVQVKLEPGCHTLLTALNLIPQVHMPWIYSCMNVFGATAAQGATDEGIALAAGIGAAVCVLVAFSLLVDNARMVLNILHFLARTLFFVGLAYCVAAVILFGLNGFGDIVNHAIYWPFPEPGIFTVLSALFLGRYLWRERAGSRSPAPPAAD
jgi:hypothetical protein